MLFRCAVLIAATASCGGSSSRDTTPRGPATVEIGLAAGVASEAWYRSPTLCGQGPYEIEVPVSGIKWGEEIELRVATPRRIAVHATVIADGEEVRRTAELFDASGVGRGKADNLRCVAGAQERRAAVAGGGGGGGGGGGVTVPDVPVGTTVVTPPARPDATAQLELEAGVSPEAAVEIVRFGWREHDRRASRIKLRLWSVEPNDLDGVRFGVIRYEWRPNVPEAEYEAHLVRVAEEQRRRAAKDAEEQRRRQEAARLRYEQELRARPAVQVDHEAELARYRREQEERRRRDEERLRQAEEDRRRRALELARRLERERRRAAFCASHPDDRGCWGAGGRAKFLELEQRVREREAYCAVNREDARCWSDSERLRRTQVWTQRVRVALEPPKQPDGPPPAPLAEDVPPKLSVNAEWRPGYWSWTGTTWTWLAGMWRVPEQDIVAELTTTAPAAPPPPRTEAIPPPPMATTVWVEGFWQWNGTAWIWVAGSYQARPEAGVVWRRTEWRPRGRVHVLIPGAWVPRASRSGGQR